MKNRQRQSQTVVKPMTEKQEKRSRTKYGERIEGHDWSNQEPDEPEARTRVDSHELDVYHDTEPEPDDNYGRERYTIRITYDRESGKPYVLYAVEHRWKGNYWRDITDWDWRDLPPSVRQCVADVLPVDSPAALNSGVRLMEEGGESRWEKHHKPRVEAMSGEEMWGTSFLRETMERAENAAEAFAEGSEEEERAEAIVTAIQEALEAIGGDDAVE